MNVLTIKKLDLFQKDKIDGIKREFSHLCLVLPNDRFLELDKKLQYLDDVGDDRLIIVPIIVLTDGNKNVCVFDQQQNDAYYYDTFILASYVNELFHNEISFVNKITETFIERIKIDFILNNVVELFNQIKIKLLDKTYDVIYNPKDQDRNKLFVLLTATVNQNLLTEKPKSSFRNIRWQPFDTILQHYNDKNSDVYLDGWAGLAYTALKNHRPL